MDLRFNEGPDILLKAAIQLLKRFPFNWKFQDSTSCFVYFTHEFLGCFRDLLLGSPIRGTHLRSSAKDRVSPSGSVRSVGINWLFSQNEWDGSKKVLFYYELLSYKYRIIKAKEQKFSSLTLLCSHHFSGSDPYCSFIYCLSRLGWISVKHKPRMTNPNRPSSSSSKPSSSASRISVHRLVDANEPASSRSHARLPPIQSLLSQTGSSSQAGSSSSARPSSLGGKVKKMWTSIEDRRLRQLAEASPDNWNVIAASLPGRTGKQCRERWLNHLRPNIRKGNWTEDEDKIILREQRRIGNKWAEIARLLPGRSDNAVKNRYYSVLTRKNESRQ